MSNLLEITGKFLDERFRFENETTGVDTIIAAIRCNGQPSNPPEVYNQDVVIKGEAQQGELSRNMTYRFFGSWKSYRNKKTGKPEKQFAFNSFVTLAPVGRDAIVAYLIHHGCGCGLGRVRAVALYEAFGEDAVRVARTDPDLVSSTLTARGLYYQNGKADQLRQSLESELATESLKLDLTGLMNGRGFPKQTVNAVIQEWGNRAATIIRRDPYRLMKFKGCGFKRCDSMYLDLGLNPTRLKRQALCAWYSVSRDSEGHTWFGRKIPDAYLRMNISGAGAKGVDVERALELAVRGKLLAVIRTKGERGPIAADGDVRWFAEYTNARRELELAEAVING